MRDLDTWLQDLNTKPLPGGVSAAALAAAMGAALLAKTTRVSLSKQDMITEDRETLQATLDLAGHQQQVLLQLAQADEQAYRAVLQARVLQARVLQARLQPDPLQPEGGPWHRATEVPICVAEACHLLLRRVPRLQGLCLPIVRPDLDIARWLLEVGLRTGLLAAETNLRAWADDAVPVSFQARIDALVQPKGGEPNHDTRDYPLVRPRRGLRRGLPGRVYRARPNR